MILFMNDIGLLQYKRGLSTVFNLSHPQSGFIDVSNLITNVRAINSSGLPCNQFVDIPDFDAAFANAVINQPDKFHSMMMIMETVYTDSDAVIMVMRDKYRDAVMEAVIKFIQQRYCCDSWIIESKEDFENCVPIKFYNPQGVINLDADLARHLQMYNDGLVPPLPNQQFNLE